MRRTEHRAGSARSRPGWQTWAIDHATLLGTPADSGALGRKAAHAVLLLAPGCRCCSCWWSSSLWGSLSPFRCTDNLLRMLLIHLGCGHSLRETVVCARQANLADLSGVALLKRLRKSKDWLYAL